MRVVEVYGAVREFCFGDNDLEQSQEIRNIFSGGYRNDLVAVAFEEPLHGVALVVGAYAEKDGHVSPLVAEALSPSESC
jgi:hypothetical protein